MERAPRPVKPREAASVILLQQPDLVYMTARPTTLRVAAGFYVFPGGRVDEPDRVWAARRGEQVDITAADGDLGSFVVAGVREVFEEVGLLLARDEAGRPLWEVSAGTEHKEKLREAREALNRGRTNLGEVLERYGWTVAADRLAYVSRWVTPPAAKRRFNTCFFVADVTGCVEPVPSPAEVSVAEWVSLQETLNRDEAGTLPLMRPTRALLHTLARLGSTEKIMAYYRQPDSLRLEVVEQNTPEVLRAVLASQGVTVVSVPSPTLLPATATNVYLISSGGEALLIDAGDGGEAGVELIMQAWKRAGKPKVQALVLTHDHPDHAGAAAALARRLGCPVAAHRAGVSRIKEKYGWKPDIVLEGGERFVVGRRFIDVVHSPGHASDHIVLHEEDGGLLFSGDNVVGEGSTWIGPPDGDMKAYLDSLARLETLRIHVIAPGHGPPLDDAPRRIRSLIDRRLARERDIIALLQPEPRSVEDLFHALYASSVPPGVEEMARRTIVGHLEKLEKDGLVAVEDNSQPGPTYTLKKRDIRP